MNACILIRVLPGKSMGVLESVKKLPEARGVFLVFGRYDIVVFAEAPSADALRKLSGEVNSIRGVKSTETLIEG
ncbi:MAG: Lrp/AsnC ligand binding domain-containing protein [Candidatus Geothermarchaeales archaeon]